jgi:hypothetical protein
MGEAQHMSYFKRAEIVGGIGVLAVGILGIIAALFLPVHSESVTLYQNGQFLGHRQENVWLIGEVGVPRAASMLATLAILALIVTIASLLHASHHMAVDLAALWGIALLLIGTVYVTSTWTSYLFLPTALLAAITLVLATMYHLLSSRPPKKKEEPSPPPEAGGDA